MWTIWRIALVCIAGCAQPGPRGPAVGAMAPEQVFLDRFAGRWVGTGESGGRRVRDEMSFSWTLEGRFLAMRYAALSGDDYDSVGYLRWNPGDRRYELYEFNNGAWPVRLHRGSRSGDALQFRERVDRRRSRLTFAFRDADTLEMTEVVEHEAGTLRVRVVFTRVAR